MVPHKLLEKIGQNPHLPSPPAIALQVVESASRPNCTIAQIARIVRHDPPLTGKILKLVNSALFGLQRGIMSIDRALTMLGLNRVRSLVLSLSLPSMQRRTPPGPWLQDYWKTAVAGAIAARHMAHEIGRPDPENEMVAGLLRDVGTLVLQEVYPERYAPVLAHSPEELAREQCELEKRVLGLHHAEVSAHILQLWRLPEEVSEAIRFHHHPGETAGMSRALGDRTWLMHFAHLVGQLQITPDQPALAEEITILARDRFGLSRERLDGFWEPLNRQMEELAALLEVDVGAWNKYSSLMASATDQLTRLAVETSLDNYRVHREKDRAEQEKQEAQEALRRTEDQLRQAQKMEAIGRLAGGVAHDFNNLLTIITGYSEMLLDSIPGEDPSRAFIEEIKKAGDRAGALTRHLLAFSRKQVLKPTSLDLNTVVGDMDKMLRRLIGANIELVTVQGSDLRPVISDPGQMEQVIMNLAVNARDAMPDGGKVTVETANVDLDEDFLPSEVDFKPGPYVQLTVSDNGCGMGDATKAHLFEPFFTTKELGKGTGLGLATVYGIVKQSGGHILVHSTLGEGTVFKIFLPLAPDQAAPDKPALVLPPIPRGARTILLAEDEEGVRKLARHILEMNGYQVIVGGDGREALKVGQDFAGPIHLLVTDTVMPHMGGRELARRLGQSHPETRVLFMSGYTDDAVIRREVLDAEVFFLQKPFTQQSLTAKVHEAFGSIHGG